MADKIPPYIHYPIKISFIRSADLSVYEKAIFMVLLTYKKCKTIYTSQAELAKHAGMSRYKAIKVLDSLAKKGYITKDNKTNHKTTVYRILNKALVNVSDSGVNESDTTCQPQQQVPVNESDTNKDKSNKDKLIIKDKKKKTVATGKNDKLITDIILMWNSVTGQSLQQTTKQYRTDIKWGIEQFTGMTDDDIKTKFRFAFENKKRMADDPEHPFTTLELPTIMRRGKFMGNVDAMPYKQKETARPITAARRMIK